MRALVVAIACLLSFPSHSHSETKNEGQVWTAVLGNAAFERGSKTGPRAWLDVHLRRSSGGLTHLFRPGLGWVFSKNVSLWAGYAWIPNISDESATVHEHRGWQQLILKRSTDSGISLQSRTRFEQRFRSSGDIGFRAREFVRVSKNLGGERNFGVVGWDELFVGLHDTDWGQRRGLDQNRLFLGGYTQVQEKLRLEMGYLLVYLNREQDVLAHVLATNLFWSY